MNYLRLRVPGARYFFTAATQDHAPLLVDGIERVLSALSAIQARRPFGLDAFVVLPDHLHMVWTLPEGDTDYSTRWRIFKRLVSAGMAWRNPRPSLDRKRELGVWQRRFWEHVIRDGWDYQRHVDFIHYDPVRHGLVGHPAEWPHGSFAVWAERYPPAWGHRPPDMRGVRLE